MRRLFFIPVILIGTFLSSLYSQSQDFSGQKTIFDLFQSEAPLSVSIQADFHTIISNKNKADEYAEGELKINRPNQSNASIPVKIKPRGKFRRKVCDFPPLKLKFKKSDLDQMGLDTFNNLKLVTHCQTGNGDDETLLREYLAYKMYSRLTDASFKVQLLQVTYYDKSGQRTPETRLALLIEDDEQLAQRLGGAVCDCFNTPVENFDSYQKGLVTLFNYMIGNPDFDVTMQRNMKIVRPLQSGSYQVVPYDFDFSGFVHPDYIKGYSSAWLKEAREKVNLDSPVSAPDAERLKQLFFQHREDFTQLLAEDSMISKKTKKRLQQYLDSFYDELGQSAILPAGTLQNPGTDADAARIIDAR